MNDVTERKPMSQGRSFLIFLVIMIAAGPVLYQRLAGEVFVPSPDWSERWMVPGLIVAGVAAVVSILIALRLTRSQSGRQRWLAVLGIPVAVAALVLSFLYLALPMALAMTHRQPVTFDVPVQTSGSNSRCKYRVTLSIFSRAVCVSRPADYVAFQRGAKMRVNGTGGPTGAFVDTYTVVP